MINKMAENNTDVKLKMSSYEITGTSIPGMPVVISSCKFEFEINFAQEDLVILKYCKHCWYSRKSLINAK